MINNYSSTNFLSPCFICRETLEFRVQLMALKRKYMPRNTLDKRETAVCLVI